MAKTKNKIDSNITGLSFACETQLGVLPNGVVGGVTIGAYVDNADYTGITLAWDDDTQELSITGTIIPGATVGTCRITRTRAGFPTVDVGVQVSIGADAGGWNTSDPVGGIGQWNSFIGQLGPSNLNVVADMSGLVQDGDILLVEFDVDLAFAGVASRTLTLDSVGTGVAIWYGVEPNGYDDFGAEIETVARSPITADRQKRKGVVVDVEADGGFATDLTQNNLTRLMQGFIFADAREKPTTHSLTKDGSFTFIEITDDPFLTVANGEFTRFIDGHIVKLTGFQSPDLNDSLRVLLDTSGEDMNYEPAFNDTEVATATTKVEVVGFQFGAGETNADVQNGKFRLTNATTDFRTLNLILGEWVCIGGDDATHRFNNNAPGFARVHSVGINVLEFDEVSWANPQTEAGAGKSIRLYFGTVIKNEDDSSLIKCQSYQLERQLGEDTAGTQSEYLVGAVANEFTLNIPSTDIITADMSFIGQDTEPRNGSDGIKAGTRIGVPIEDAFNTSSHVYQMRIYVHDETAVTPSSLFGFVLEADVSINNNVSGLKAIGVTGNFDINVGDFEVTGELNCYFATVEAVKAVRNNADVGFNVIGVRDNAGWVFDIPLLSLGGGRVNVEKDNPIMLPLEKMGAKNDNGYTLLTNWFNYLPNAVMDTE